MSWKEFRLKIPLEWKDAVSNRLFELGASALEEKETGESVLLTVPVPESNLGTFREGVSVYLTSLSALSPTGVRYEVQEESVKEVDWAAEYRKYYFAQPLSRRFFLRPAWDTQTEIPQGQIPIVLDPGQAFGTGLHATTKLSLELMDRALKGQDTVRSSVLDVGTGTGILAIAASKLGVEKILGIDNDPIAIEIAKENSLSNGCGGIEWIAGTLTAVGEKFSLILSNILLETHRELMGLYEERLAGNGSLVLSGVLSKQRSELESMFLQRGWKLMELEEMGEWVAATFKR